MESLRLPGVADHHRPSNKTARTPTAQAVWGIMCKEMPEIPQDLSPKTKSWPKRCPKMPPKLSQRSCVKCGDPCQGPTICGKWTPMQWKWNTDGMQNQETHRKWNANTSKNGTIICANARKWKRTTICANGMSNEWSDLCKMCIHIAFALYSHCIHIAFTLCSPCIRIAFTHAFTLYSLCTHSVFTLHSRPRPRQSFYTRASCLPGASNSFHYIFQPFWSRPKVLY